MTSLASGQGSGNGTHNPSHNGRGFAVEVPKGDQLPPQNLDAERQLLAACAIDNAIIPDVLDRLSPEDFYREAHRVLFRSVLDLHGKGLAVDAVSLLNELGPERYERLGGNDFFADVFASAPHAANWETHLAIIRQHSIRRQTIQAGTSIVRESYSHELTAAESLERAITRLSAICDGEAEGAGDQHEIRDFPAPPGPAAFHGVMGEILRELDPHTEANLAAILCQLLVGFGNMVGVGPHWVHEANRHRLNLYLCVVGNTADGKKGTSWGYARRILTAIDDTWSLRITPGINSGPALIEQVADEENTRGGSFLRGVTDKRLLMYESEFTRLLAIFSRDNETLGMVLRQAWEDDQLAALSKKNPVRATGAHVSVNAHVTADDLHANLRLTDVANGLGNRFLWVCARASKKLEEEGRFPWNRLDPLLDELRLSLEFARRHVGLDPVPMGRSPSAQRFWKEQLEILRKPRPGLLGAILARGPAQVMRLACIYAVIDRQMSIGVDHLKAALEIWAYCVRSIDFIFGERLGDPDAEKLLAAIEAAGETGLSQSRIQREVFRTNKDSGELAFLLRRMIRSGLIRRESKRVTGAGRPACMWFLEAPPPQGGNEFTKEFPGNAG
jgi:hypothetical protein